MRIRSRLGPESVHNSFRTKKWGTQKFFYGHYVQDDNEGKGNWQLTMIDQCTTNAGPRKRDLLVT